MEQSTQETTKNTLTAGKDYMRTKCLWDHLTAHWLGHLQSNRSQTSTWKSPFSPPLLEALADQNNHVGNHGWSLVFRGAAGGKVYCENFSLSSLWFPWDVTDSSSAKKQQWCSNTHLLGLHRPSSRRLGQQEKKPKQFYKCSIGSLTFFFFLIWSIFFYHHPLGGACAVIIISSSIHKAH